MRSCPAHHAPRATDHRLPISTLPDSQPTGYVALSDVPSPGSIAQFEIDQTTGIISSIAASAGTGTGAMQNGLAMRLDGRFIYATTSLTDLIWAFEIDSTEGRLTTLPGYPIASGGTPNAPTMGRSGRFVYVSNSSANTLSVYSSNLATGALTPVPGSPFPTGSAPFDQVVVP